MGLLPARVRAYRRRHAFEEYRLLRPLARRAGYDLLLAGYYSPVPDLGALPPATWTDPEPMPGVEWDLDRQLRWIDDELAPALMEFRPPADPPGNQEGYHYRNSFFVALDADVLYGVVRSLRPPRVLEIGSGFSTLVIAGAAARNRAEGSPLRHEVVDPHPSPRLERVASEIELQALPAERIPVEHFASLQAGEMLFVDSTHTVRPGGDVVHLVLRVLPQLKPGVIVHFHDFYRPFEYPRMLMDHFGAYWQEHHLLQALLAGGELFDVLCANHALARLRPERVAALVPGLEADMVPSSLWLRRR